MPSKIKLHELPEERRNRAPINPNIPYADYARGSIEGEDSGDDEQEALLSLEEIMVRHNFLLDLIPFEADCLGRIHSLTKAGQRLERY